MQETSKGRLKGAPVARSFVSTGCRFRYGYSGTVPATMERGKKRKKKKKNKKKRQKKKKWSCSLSAVVEPIEKQIRIRAPVERRWRRWHDPSNCSYSGQFAPGPVPQEIVIYSVTVFDLINSDETTGWQTPRKINSTDTIFAGIDREPSRAQGEGERTA